MNYVYNPYTKTWYGLYKNLKTWEAAKNYCETKGEALATFESRKSAEWYTTYLLKILGNCICIQNYNAMQSRQTKHGELLVDGLLFDSEHTTLMFGLARCPCWNTPIHSVLTHSNAHHVFEQHISLDCGSCSYWTMWWVLPEHSEEKFVNTVGKLIAHSVHINNCKYQHVHTCSIITHLDSFHNRVVSW